jgi:hypothetical protein
LQTIAENEATGGVAEIYGKQIAQRGFVMSARPCFTARPELLPIYTEICDIAPCASFRCFVSRFFDAVGAGPEAAFINSDEEYRTAMTVGKAI